MSRINSVPRLPGDTLESLQALRDEFAGKAMAAQISVIEYMEAAKRKHGSDFDAVLRSTAKSSYQIADAMLEARAK